jgi:enterochelin esterase-like enzyme
MKHHATFLFGLLLGLCLQAQIPRSSSGRIERIDSFQSQYVTPRNVDVWLPEGYDPAKKYAVLYMHDGQMLFDSTITWNKQCWQVDETISKLIAARKIEPYIVVGIWNGGITRHPDYFPQKPFDGLTQTEKDQITRELQEKGRTQAIFQPQSDNYLRFLVAELKPFIDKRYSTYTDAAHTAIAGSSMGGLISLYAICEYPSVFGKAAGLSTHWPGTFSVDGNPFISAMRRYLQENLPDPKTHRIYLDGGDQELDALYPPLLKAVEIILRQKGYTDSTGRSRVITGTGHSERAWSARLGNVVLYLLGGVY